ncbi:unnamed protein product [Sphenostylis stenocarpa]|uniref:Uncharacterized protein n=1 Tax=Sphenostylis stenocarpa TaxID=92480 RepID=A0AA86SE68_9FABA|nr:unnamed protein product [Sphenostylis stenocarpa]
MKGVGGNYEIVQTMISERRGQRSKEEVSEEPREKGQVDQLELGLIRLYQQKACVCVWWLPRMKIGEAASFWLVLRQRGTA